MFHPVICLHIYCIHLTIQFCQPKVNSIYHSWVSLGLLQTTTGCYGHAELSRSGIPAFPLSSNCKITMKQQEKLEGILIIAEKAGFGWLLKKIGQLSATISKNFRYEAPSMLSGTSQKCTVQKQIVHSPEFGRAIPLIPCQPLR